MVFSSAVFLSLFFPIFLLLYFLFKKTRYKNIVLVLSSIVFYAWGEPVWVLLLLLSGWLDYINGLIIGKYHGRWQAKAAVTLSVIENMLILGTFKYSGFLVGNINALLGTELPIPQFNLPIGVSFYTFQTLTYTIDAYRGKFKPQKSLLNYLTYLTMFPQLVAGPIVRYLEVGDLLAERSITKEQISAGITRFAVGMGKKVILANSAGSAASLLLDGNLSVLSGAGAWLGISLFAFQIYFDFSGYSDMAIGMGKMLGFTFPENFNYPYISKSVTEFWRRWHISLGSFFRDYVYIPLGGNRRMQLRNLTVVWFLTGLWHGASWNFILWGLYYLVLLVLEKYVYGRILDKMPWFVRHTYSLIAIVAGWSLFYYTSLEQLLEFVKAGLFMNGVVDPLTTSIFTGRMFLIIVCIIACTPLPKLLAQRFAGQGRTLNPVIPLFNAALLVVSFMLVLAQSFNPFLYFTF